MPAGSKIDQELDTLLGESFSKLSLTELGPGMRKHFAFDEGWLNLNHGSNPLHTPQFMNPKLT